MKPTVGRIVHYGLAAGHVRAAIIVRVWNEDADTESNPGACSLQLQVFTDGFNDQQHVNPGEAGQNVVWRTSVAFAPNLEPGKWSWPPRA